MSELHLSRAELIAWRDEGAGDRTRIVAHLAACVACRELAADVERLRPAESGVSRFDAGDFVARGYQAGISTAARSSRRWLWAAAAAAVVVLAFLPVWLRDDAGDTMRGGTTLVAVRPVDTTVSIDDLVFEWRGPADRVRLNVVDLDRAETPVIEREVTGSRYAPTPEERSRFRTGQSLHWYVEARSGPGGTSPAASFRVR
jgi:hypothetical protein